VILVNVYDTVLLKHRIYDGFLFRIKHVLSAEKKPVISNKGNFFCFNNNVSYLYNNDVIIYKIKKKS